MEDSQGYMIEDQTKRKMMKKKNLAIGRANGRWPRLPAGDRKIGAKPRWWEGHQGQSGASGTFGQCIGNSRIITINA
jgi:hypothetical protein